MRQKEVEFACFPSQGFAGCHNKLSLTDRDIVGFRKLLFVNKRFSVTLQKCILVRANGGLGPHVNNRQSWLQFPSRGPGVIYFVGVHDSPCVYVPLEKAVLSWPIGRAPLVAHWGRAIRASRTRLDGLAHLKNYKWLIYCVASANYSRCFCNAPLQIVHPSVPHIP